jgi:hypothetical protein
MKHALLVAGAVAAGVSAVYFLDQKQGAKRRKILKKKADRVLREAANKWNDYSHELKPYLDKYSKEFAHGAENVAKQGFHRVEEATHNGWAPSARMLGATAGAMAFYGAGRKGMIGAVVRLVSLGLLTRALMASK